MKVRDSDILA